MIVQCGAVGQVDHFCVPVFLGLRNIILCHYGDIRLYVVLDFGYRCCNMAKIVFFPSF